MTTTPRQWRVVRAFQDNGPIYWLIFGRKKTFEADPIAKCDNRKDAERIVREHNAHDPMRDAIEKLLNCALSIGDGEYDIPVKVYKNLQAALALAKEER